jgi:hypothetical protein
MIAHSIINPAARVTTRGSGPSGTRPGRYGSEVPRIPCRACSSEPVSGGPGLHIREFGLVAFQDRLAVEPDRDPGAGALDLDRVPVGSRPRRVGGRALVSTILRSSLDAKASVLSRAVSGKTGPMPKGGIPVYLLRRVDLIRVGPARDSTQRSACHRRWQRLAKKIRVKSGGRSA